MLEMELEKSLEPFDFRSSSFSKILRASVSLSITYTVSLLPPLPELFEM